MANLTRIKEIQSSFAKRATFLTIYTEGKFVGFVSHEFESRESSQPEMRWVVTSINSILIIDIDNVKGNTFLYIIL